LCARIVHCQLLCTSSVNEKMIMNGSIVV